MAAGNVRRAGAPGYRRRRPLPALILLAVLGLVAGIVWFKIIGTDDVATAAPRCDPPAAPPSAVEGQPAPTLGQAVAADSLDRTTPVPAQQALVRVVNASGQNRHAGAVTEDLRELGFTQIGDPANDALYAGGSMSCRAQIRFGQQGTAAARTLSLLEPCAELVKDERQDATVDLAIGKKFDALRPRPEARRVVEVLTEWAQQHPEAQGGLQGDGAATPVVDGKLLTAARDARC